MAHRPSQNIATRQNVSRQPDMTFSATETDSMAVWAKVGDVNSLTWQPDVPLSELCSRVLMTRKVWLGHKTSIAIWMNSRQHWNAVIRLNKRQIKKEQKVHREWVNGHPRLSARIHRDIRGVLLLDESLGALKRATIEGREGRGSSMGGTSFTLWCGWVSLGNIEMKTGVKIWWQAVQSN